MNKMRLTHRRFVRTFIPANRWRFAERVTRVVAVLATGFALYLAVLSPRAVVERVHGVRLPRSAVISSHEERAGSWGRLDKNASAEFSIAARDLPPFVAQLRPGPDKYRAWFGFRAGEWRRTWQPPLIGCLMLKEGRLYCCHSDTGNLLIVLVEAEWDDRVRIRLRTDAN